jgi:hypothetical protein
MPTENNLENLESPEESKLENLKLTPEENVIFDRLQEILNKIDKIPTKEIPQGKLDEMRFLFNKIKIWQDFLPKERFDKITTLLKENNKGKN